MTTHREMIVDYTEEVVQRQRILKTHVAMPMLQSLAELDADKIEGPELLTLHSYAAGGFGHENGYPSVTTTEILDRQNIGGLRGLYL